LTTLIILFHF